MPGLVGLVTNMPPDRARAELRRMVDSVRHESFYQTGTWCDEALGVYVGWSVQRGSFSDGMPLTNEARNTVLLFSGEEFAEPGIERRLKERGHQLEAGGPEYLIHLAEDDRSFPASLNGRFHGLLVNLPQRTATLFNDRYGMHRLYYHEAKDGFYFAAEAKAILAVCRETRTPDARGLGEFISNGCVLENRSLFKGVHVLPGGAAWVFRGGSLEEKKAYFQPREWEEQTTLDEEGYYRELRDVFSRNLPRYFEGREQIGVSLTGGLDTRMIMAWHKGAPGSLPSYTYGSMFRDCRDVTVAREVARICQQPYQVMPAGREFLSRFAHYAERAVRLTDGCVDVSHAPDLYLSELARGIAPVRMTGLYGSEVLRAVRAFKPMEPMAGLYQPELLSHVRAARTTYAEQLSGHPLTFAAFKQAPWHHYGPLAVEQTQLSVRSPYLDNDLVRTVFRAPASACASNDVCLRLIGDGDVALRRLGTDRGIGGARGPLATKAVRAFHEFVFKVEYAFDYGMPQWAARIDHLLSPIRPERFVLGRHKPYHFRVWYRDVLSKYVQDILLDPKSLARPYVERRQLESVVNGHVSGRQNHTTEIHQLLTLELFHRVFLDAMNAA